MSPYVPSLWSLMETLRLAEQGYWIDDTPLRPAVRPMPWRRILHHLIAMGREEVLQIEPGTDPSGNSDIVVRRIAKNGQRPVPASAAHGAAIATPGRANPVTVRTGAGLRALTRFAQRIETTVQRGQCCVTCVKTHSYIRAYMTGPAAAVGDGAAQSVS